LHIPHFLIVTVYFLVILGIMVVVHEFGHFAVAKLCGVRVEAFSIGMGKRLFGYVHNGTDYKVCALPIGGYVKMTGETEMEMIQTSPTETETLAQAHGDSGNFNTKPRWQRVLVALAGPVANFILAIVIFTAVAHFHHETVEYLQDRSEVDYVAANSIAAKTGIGAGDSVVKFDTVSNPSWQDIEIHGSLKQNVTVPFAFMHNGQRVDSTLPVTFTGGPEDFSTADLGLIPRMQAGPVVVSDIPDATSPAAQAGLVAKDAIVTIDGHPFHSTEATRAYLRDSNGKAVVLGVLHNGTMRTLTVTPRLGPSQNGTAQYQLGFVAVQYPVVTTRQPLGAALKTGWKDFTKSSLLIFDVLGGMFKREVSVRNLSGPVGIAQQVGLAQQMGTWTVLQLMAGISLNLGIFNLLPMPVLDGGMILFLLIESVMRRDVNAVLKERIYQAAFVCIIVFAVLVIFNDFSKLPIFTHHPS
jgi:regulator of sigma E protease